MITSLIDVARPSDPDAIDRLADTLAALIPGVAAGLIGDAVIMSAQMTAALATIADGSGATLVPRPDGPPCWSVAAAAARREWVLCLAAGDVPRDGWIRILDRFTATARPEVALARLRRRHETLASTIAAHGERLVGAGRARAGDLVRRDKLMREPAFAPRLRPHRLPVWLERA